MEKTINQKETLNQIYLKKYIRESLMPDRFINVGRNAKVSKVIGLVGPRGSMKSLSESAITIVDFLIPGYEVYSNMDIGWGLTLGDVTVGYHSQHLDKADLLHLQFEKALVVIDEINLEFSEARRSMTNRNLSFNKIIQQIRKKQLNLIYTVQHEMWIDSRLRWQTDMFIKCEDTLLRPGGYKLPYGWGEIGHWRVYDMRGFLGAGTYADTQRISYEGTFYGKRWWNTFDTNAIQGDEEEDYGSIDYRDAQFSPVMLKLQSAVQDTIEEWQGLNILEIEESDLFYKLEQLSGVNIIGLPRIEKEIRNLMRQATKTGYRHGNRTNYYSLGKFKEKDLSLV